MAAASDVCEFDSWLSKKLLHLNEDADLDVFVQYIKGILETETDAEELNESLMGLLGQITENDLDIHCAEITSKYTELVTESNNMENKGVNSLEKQLVSALEKQNSQAVQTQAKPLTKEDVERRKAKEAILQQFAQVSSGEEDNNEDAEDAQVEGLSVNINAKLVVQRQVAEREKNKQEHERKKQKDKEDREKQKQKAQDRKEAEKKRTQKGERKR